MLLLLVAILGVGFIASQSQAAISCNKAYSETPAFFQFTKTFLDIRKDSPWTPGFNTHIPTVKSEIRISTKHGDLFVFERLRSTWATDFSADGINYQGDPRWFTAIVGAKTGNHFGFFQVSQKSMTGPTAEYANQAIAKANQKLNEEFEINIRFRETGDIALSDVEYLVDFRNRIMPIAELGYYTIHDLSYHFSGILYPKRVLEIANTRVDLTLGFRKWVDRLGSKDVLERALLREVADAEIKRRAQRIDSSSGSLTYFLAMATVDKSHPDWAKAQSAVVDTLFFQNKSAVTEIRAALLRQLNLNNRHSKADREKAKALIEDYLATMTDARYHTKHELKVDDFFAEIGERIAALRAALADNPSDN